MSAEMKRNSQTQQNFPLDIVGSSTYGRDPKIMASRTFNMITSDNWLTGYFGYKKVISTQSAGNGRAIFTSVRSNRIIAVIGKEVYSVSITNDSAGNKIYNAAVVGRVQSITGNVFIDENNVDQVAICDLINIYIYNTQTGTFQIATLPPGLVPGFVTYQNGRFVVPNTKNASWALSAVGDGLNWFWGSSGQPVLGGLQTKPDFAQATLRVAGRGNLLFVMGNTVTELWTDIGASPFPYQRSYSVNIDYGCVNPATLASSEQIIAWLGSNEKSGPVIMYSTGSDVQQVSTDGINYRLTHLNHPESSSAFFMKLSGHLFYHLTFYDPSDNYTVIYDFTDKKFYDATDEQMNFHIARDVAFFDDDYYFVSFNDGNIYQANDTLTTYDYGTFSDDSPKVYEIPKVRVCSNMRAPNAFRFIANNIAVTMEQGNDTTNDGNDPNYNPRIGLSVSKNGGISFSGYASRPVYQVGNRMNRLNWWQMGAANDFVPQFRFWGKGPWRITNGVLSIYQ